MEEVREKGGGEERLREWPVQVVSVDLLQVIFVILTVHGLYCCHCS